ncbi:uncharacterized protein N0V89_003335 [Didymosphaeria variabile]|uniref:Uncharacterized protein n=1 Tax=Didymosphaeria variabile TaxID=1932322 RepID=A0A9W8XU91_9PLEO|nr:uncharacterized protein N0V89_003335 [Didymosphaeria variabile]KAJ4358751.1 hypothetical protein N0V89_003335 [Didymosphaeria variabile]
MPRQGDGSSDNGPFEEAQHDILHGAGSNVSDHVARADKTTPMPEVEKGEGIEGLNASGGGLSLPSTGDQGKGPLLSDSKEAK